jgi:hypothetical protein
MYVLGIHFGTRYIDRVRNALPEIPVGYVDAYYEFEDRPIAN